MVLKFIEDKDKYWALGVPVKQALEIAPHLDWEKVYIRVVDPPQELIEKRIDIGNSYIFSWFPMKGSIESSWCQKRSRIEYEEDEEEYVEECGLQEDMQKLTAEEVQELLSRAVIAPEI